jgi:hypothetical protein
MHKIGKFARESGGKKPRANDTTLLTVTVELFMHDVCADAV